MKKILISCLLSFPILSFAQTNSISLDTCYALAKNNYPLVKRYELIDKSREYNIENIAKGYLPGISINGQATYQSDVTTIPLKIPGVDIPEPDKDQYKIYAEVNQPLYDGGVIKQQKKLEDVKATVDKQSLEVQLYELKERVNQLFFGILLTEEQQKQNELLKKDIQLGLERANAAIANGTALKSSSDILKAELLKAGQQAIELKANREALSEMLSLFIHRSLNENTTLIKPQNLIVSGEIKRPELKGFDFQNLMLDAQNDLLTAANRPKLGLFIQGGYGKPAFNIFSNRFDAYYIGGLRLSIPLSGFYTLKNKRALIDIHRENITAQKETFLFNTRFAMKQQNADIVKLEEMIKSDQEIILLRSSIKETALSQLQNGVINTRDYLREVNAEDHARQQRILHEIQLLQAEYHKKITTGN